MQTTNDIGAPQQTRETHARLFARYLSNCTLADMQAILKAKEDCMHAAMNYGNRAQIDASDNKRAIVERAVNRMLASDLRYNDQMIADANKA